MEKRQLGKTDIYLPPLTFGAWAIGGNMWGGADTGEAVKAMQKSIEMGITSIDTAPVYGFGLSEQLVGKAIKPFAREKLQILTKCGLVWDTNKGHYFFEDTLAGNAVQVMRHSGKQSIIRECENSLNRLDTDYIDLLQIHWHDKTTPIEEAMEALAILIEHGKIRAAGVSNYSAEQMLICRETFEIASNQVPYSLVKRNIEADILPCGIENNIGIIAYSPLQRGVLTGKFSTGHRFERGDTRAYEREYQSENIIKINSFLEEIQPIAEAHNATVGQLAIYWVMVQKGVTTTLVGARDEQQVNENIRTLQLELTAGELQFITQKANSIELL